MLSKYKRLPDSLDYLIQTAKELADKNENTLAAKKYIETTEFHLFLKDIPNALECYAKASHLDSKLTKSETRKLWGSFGDEALKEKMMVAVECQRAGKSKESLELFQLLADQEYCPAQFNLAIHYWHSESANRDLEKAIYYFTEVLTSEDSILISKANFFLGQCYREQGDLESAKSFYKASADSGYLEGQYHYGYLLDAEENFAEAFKYFKLAADQETTVKILMQSKANSEYFMGYYFENAIAVTKSLVKAKEYYRKAAVKENSNALYRLGNLYKLENKPELAAGFFKKAADLGLTDAQLQLAVSFRSSSIYEFKMEYLKPAAEQGHVVAQICLGWCYQRGESIEKDENQAFEWYSKAAEQKDPTGSFLLAFSYFHGIGVAKNGEVAVKIWEETIAQELGASSVRASSHFHLAQCYKLGFGVKPDLKTALKHYEASIEDIVVWKDAWLDLAGLFADPKKGLSFADFSEKFRSKYKIPKNEVSIFCLKKSSDFFDNTIHNDEYPKKSTARTNNKADNNKNKKDDNTSAKPVDAIDTIVPLKLMECRMSRRFEEFGRIGLHISEKFEREISELLDFLTDIITNLEKSNDKEYNLLMMDLILSICGCKTVVKLGSTISIIKERCSKDEPLKPEKQTLLYSLLSDTSIMINFLESYIPSYHSMLKAFWVTTSEEQQSVITQVQLHMDANFKRVFALNASMRQEFDKMRAYIKQSRANYLYKLGLQAEKTCPDDLKLNFYKDRLAMNPEENREAFINWLGKKSLIERENKQGIYKAERKSLAQSAKKIELIRNTSGKISTFSAQELIAISYIKQAGINKIFFSGIGALKKIALHLGISYPYLESVKNCPLIFHSIGSPDVKKLSKAHFAGTLDDLIFEYNGIQNFNQKIQLSFHKEKFTIFSLYISEDGKIIDESWKLSNEENEALNHFKMGIISTVDNPREAIKKDPLIIIEAMELKKLLGFQNLADDLKTAIKEYTVGNLDKTLSKIEAQLEKKLNKSEIFESLKLQGLFNFSGYPVFFSRKTGTKSETDLSEKKDSGRRANQVLRRTCSESDSIYVERKLTP
jgi:TPR repeat protein